MLKNIDSSAVISRMFIINITLARIWGKLRPRKEVLGGGIRN